ncbi:1-aminocyclopropane-1-carboxylate deaminase/D-cysteine desulfhydrase [Robertkochia marina]|uniref:1-aminocyclopropane-1-carboxylate deaminase/D-cysteine desulfhydrase n=1 Tax=Robertkochia marina TaxID=1227945 RepID=A0A4S3M116_9FLAO|nr:1-aminocyclopropane-1-carboxylate deaminase/D-cysteine desulfhydrase [Robertkochia marina]TRZ43835.1 1-aminocyclopropane-1-carboxylate deaminase/D-cysteine desulfhydrase [Robertkochia marina]
MVLFIFVANTPPLQNQKVDLEIFEKASLEVHLKREDEIHPVVSGNKFRKLKYNLLHVLEHGYRGVLTFGGAFSNHIAATAYACKEAGIPCAGVIRGEELKDKPLNDTLAAASSQGMLLHFVSRETYREKMSSEMKARWRAAYPGYYILPEGGSNDLAVRGCAEILTAEDARFDVICAAVGTGGTLAGLITGSHPGQHVIGFPALKGDFLKEEIVKFVQSENWSLQTRFHFGGYARINEILVDFMNSFKLKTGIPLDPVYTAKMMYGIQVLAEEGYFNPGTKILAIHTGGLQGIPGMNRELKRKKLPLIL